MKYAQKFAVALAAILASVCVGLLGARLYFVKQYIAITPFIADAVWVTSQNNTKRFPMLQKRISDSPPTPEEISELLSAEINTERQRAKMAASLALALLGQMQANAHNVDFPSERVGQRYREITRAINVFLRRNAQKATTDDELSRLICHAIRIQIYFQRLSSAEDIRQWLYGGAENNPSKADLPPAITEMIQGDSWPPSPQWFPLPTSSAMTVPISEFHEK